MKPSVCTVLMLVVLVALSGREILSVPPSSREAVHPGTDSGDPFDTRASESNADGRSNLARELINLADQDRRINSRSWQVLENGKSSIRVSVRILKSPPGDGGQSAAKHCIAQPDGKVSLPQPVET